MSPYRDTEPTNIEAEKEYQWCEVCRFRHHPGLDFVAYGGTVCYVADRIAAAFNLPPLPTFYKVPR